MHGWVGKGDDAALSSSFMDGRSHDLGAMSPD